MRKIFFIILSFIILTGPAKAEVYFCPNPGEPLPKDWNINYGVFFNPEWSEAGELITKNPIFSTLDNKVFDSQEDAFKYKSTYNLPIKLACAYKNLDPTILIPLGLSVYKILGT